MVGFAIDMLDGFEVLYRRTEGVLEVSQHMAEFFKRLSIVESEYAKLLMKLTKGFAQKKLVANPHLDGTVRDGWLAVFQAVDSVAAKHESGAQFLMKDLSKGMSDFVKEKEITRRKLTTDGQKLTKDMKTHLDNLARAKSNFIKLSKEAEAAAAAVTKCPTDAASAKKLSGLHQKAQQATEKAQSSDQEYHDTLKVTNQKQTAFYTTEMPNLLHEFQQFEEERVIFTKNLLTRHSSYLQEIPPVEQAAADVATQASSKIDQNTDIATFVQHNQTGVTPPPAIEYQPFEGNITVPTIAVAAAASPAASPPSRASVAPAQSPRASVVPTKIGTYKPPEIQANREWGLTARDDSLTPEQKQNKLQAQLTELDVLIRTELTTKSGVEKLIQFYASDPAAQKKAEGELAEAERKIKALQEGERTIRKHLAELGVRDEYSNDEAQGASVVPLDSAAKARGLFDYNATCDTELSFKEGDILRITEQDPSGWWYAELNGKTGFIPQNYVELSS